MTATLALEAVTFRAGNGPERAFYFRMHAAVSAREGRVKLSDPGEGHWGFRTEAAADGEIQCVTINDIFRQNDATHFPFIVKIDIEGGEAALFSDATEWVGQTPILIIELHDWLLPKCGVSRSF